MFDSCVTLIRTWSSVATYSETQSKPGRVPYNNNKPMEPIAKRLRQSAESALLPTAAKKHKKREGSEAEDIAERIRRLEAELQQSGGSSDESDASSSDSDDDSATDGDSKAAAGGVVSLSAFADERVEALPEKLLPPQGASSASALAHGKKKKPKRTPAEATTNQPDLLDVIEWPKKVPFACKPCGFVGKDMDDFQAHRQSAEHLERATHGQQKLHCKLCDKAFTSSSQLTEHKAGKWHQQRLHKKKERHVVRVCYDFMRGTCRRGDRCAFEHAETKAMKRGAALDKTKRRACDAFARTGKCRFGDKCLFSHAPSE